MNTHRKGSAWRREVELWLGAQGFATTVRGLGYAGDDIGAVLGPLVLSVEAKNQRAIELASFVDQAEANAGHALPVVVIHRRGRAGVEHGYVVMPGWAYKALLDQLGQL